MIDDVKPFLPKAVKYSNILADFNCLQESIEDLLHDYYGLWVKFAKWPRWYVFKNKIRAWKNRRCIIEVQFVYNPIPNPEYDGSGSHNKYKSRLVQILYNGQTTRDDFDAYSYVGKLVCNALGVEDDWD